MSKKILICEDEENIVSFLKTELEYEDFQVDTALDGDEGLKLWSKNEYDLILLDIMLPIKNGLECLREIRKTSECPVIVLTARKEVYDKVAFLNAGADDYVTKPFDTMELIARINRHIKRQNKKTLLFVNKNACIAEIEGNKLNLTKTEFDIISFLHENKNRVTSRDEIIKAVFGDFYGESNIVDSNIKNIRAKISKITTKKIIETVHSRGYVIRDE